jgi:hypothetical protein
MVKVSDQWPIARMIISERQMNIPVAEEKIAQFVSEIGMDRFEINDIQSKYY